LICPCVPRYATHWVVDRRLEPRSRELYAMLLRVHIMPWFSDMALDRITPPLVRLWRSDLLRQGRSESTAAKSYRLLRAILNTAVKDDRLLRENPCRMRGFDKEPTSLQNGERVPGRPKSDAGFRTVALIHDLVPPSRFTTSPRALASCLARRSGPASGG
jgi:hypothetical protein